MPEIPVPRPGEAAPPRVVLCPYCGEVSKDPTRCDACRGHFDPLSRQATQNSMGPWFIRDAANPHRPGCSFEVLRGLVERGKIEPGTVIRGPTTNQFWSPARRAPGVANLMGVCHNCGGPAGADDVACLTCGATFRYHIDRQHLGLTEVRLLPGQAPPEAIAAWASTERTGGGRASARPQAPRISAALPPANIVSAGPEGTEGGVPRWVFVLAGVAVLGAGVAAAWIMDELPGFPSPTRSGAKDESDTGGHAGGGVRREGPEPAASGEDKPVRVEPVSGASEEVVRGEPAGAPVLPRDEKDQLAEVRRLLNTGSEEALRQAAELARQAGDGAGAAALRQAAEGLLGQAGLRRLP